MKRDAVPLRTAISPQIEVFSRLTASGLGIVTEDQIVYFRDVHDHLLRAFETVETYRELMSGASDAYLSNVLNRMNEVMQRLTVVAALFLPISFLTGLLGMVSGKRECHRGTNGDPDQHKLVQPELVGDGENVQLQGLKCEIRDVAIR